MSEPTKATAEWTDPDGDVWTFSEPTLTCAWVQFENDRPQEYDIAIFAISQDDAALRAAFLAWHRATYVLQPDECYPPGELPRKMAEDEARCPKTGKAFELHFIEHCHRIGSEYGPVVGWHGWRGHSLWWPGVSASPGDVDGNPGQLARIKAFWNNQAPMGDGECIDASTGARRPMLPNEIRMPDGSAGEMAILRQADGHAFVAVEGYAYDGPENALGTKYPPGHPFSNESQRARAAEFLKRAKEESDGQGKAQASSQAASSDASGPEVRTHGEADAQVQVGKDGQGSLDSPEGSQGPGSAPTNRQGGLDRAGDSGSGQRPLTPAHSPAPKDELPEDVTCPKCGGDGQGSQSAHPADVHDEACDFCMGDDKVPPRALAYYDEQVRKQKTPGGVKQPDSPGSSAQAEPSNCAGSGNSAPLVNRVAPSGGDSALLRDDPFVAMERAMQSEARKLLLTREQLLPKPSYIPPNAPFCWVTDGLGRQVGAWAEVYGSGLVIHMWEPNDAAAWLWSPAIDHGWIDTNRERKRSTALQCRALYARCVVDDEGRVGELLWSDFLGLGVAIEGSRYTLRRVGDVAYASELVSITATDQVAKVRAFIEQTKGESDASGILTPNAVPTEADEQASSVGPSYLLCPSCGDYCRSLPALPPNDDYPEGHWTDGTKTTCQCGAQLVVYADGEAAELNEVAPPSEPTPTAQDLATAKAARPMDEPEPPFAGMAWEDATDDDGEPVHRLTIGPLDLHRYRDGLVIFHQVPDYHDAALLLTDLTCALVGVVPGFIEDVPGVTDFIAYTNEQTAKLRTAESERDTALARAEKAEALLKEETAAHTKQILILAERRNEAQARVRELEDRVGLQATNYAAAVGRLNERVRELEAANARIGDENAALHQRFSRTEAELASVTAQRDRAWEEQASIACEARKFADRLELKYAKPDPGRYPSNPLKKADTK